MCWPGQFQPAYLRRGHYLESSLFLNRLSTGSKNTKTQQGTTGDRIVYTGATFHRRGWTQITGLMTLWGVSSCTTSRSRAWGKKPKQNWVRGASRLICQGFMSEDTADKMKHTTGKELYLEM